MRQGTLLVVCAVALCARGAAGAQGGAASSWLNTSRWLEANYRHADVRTTISTRQLQRLLSDQDGLTSALQDLQHETTAVIRSSRLSENFQAAIEAIRESRANLMSMGALSGPSPAGRAVPDLYLLAFRDGVVRAAVAYWVESGTLHYVTMDRTQHEAPLDTVDRDLSLRLNRERNIELWLESPPAAPNR